MVLAPLPKSAGGWGACEHQFSGKDDIEYRAMLAAIRKGSEQMEKVARFGTEAFKPNRQYVREMKKFGVLPAGFDVSRDAIDIFETDQKYFELFWCRPSSEDKWAYID